MHGRNPGFVGGDHWNVCQRCGFDMRNSESLEEWTGLIVCGECYEPRHPQDFVLAPTDDMSPQGLTTSVPTSTDVVVGKDLGDTDVTLTYLIDPPRVKFATTLTANRTVTLDTSSAGYLAWFRIERYDTEAYTIDINGLVTMPVSTQYYAEVQYNGTAWVLLSSGAL